MHLRTAEDWTGSVQNMYNLQGYTNDKKFTQ